MLSKRFPKANRLLKRREFRRFSHFIKLKFIVIDFRHAERSRLGLTVSKRFGNAVKRNRFKRLVREAYRQNPPKNLEINVRPRPSSEPATLENIMADLKDVEQKSKTSSQPNRGQGPHSSRRGKREDDRAYSENRAHSKKGR